MRAGQGLGTARVRAGQGLGTARVRDGLFCPRARQGLGQLG